MNSLLMFSAARITRSAELFRDMRTNVLGENISSLGLDDREINLFLLSLDGMGSTEVLRVSRISARDEKSSGVLRKNEDTNRVRGDETSSVLPGLFNRYFSPPGAGLARLTGTSVFDSSIIVNFFVAGWQ